MVDKTDPGFKLAGGVPEEHLGSVQNLVLLDMDNSMHVFSR